MFNKIERILNWAESKLIEKSGVLFCETTEGYDTYMMEDGSVRFINPRTGRRVYP